MTMIRPSTDLRNDYNEISKICKETKEPIFITKNGHEDLVVMSQLAFEEFEYDRIDKMVSNQKRLFSIYKYVSFNLKNIQVTRMIHRNIYCAIFDVSDVDSQEIKFLNDIRRITINNYTIFYKVCNDTVLLLDLLYRKHSICSLYIKYRLC